MSLDYEKEHTMKRTLAATLAAISLGAGAIAAQASGTVYGGIDYQAEFPTRSGSTIYSSFWYAGTATVTGTLQLRTMICNPGCFVAASRDITLLRGTSYNASPLLTLNCWAGRGTLPVRGQAKFAGGAWSVSNKNTFVC